MRQALAGKLPGPAVVVAAEYPGAGGRQNAARIIRFHRQGADDGAGRQCRGFKFAPGHTGVIAAVDGAGPALIRPGPADAGIGDAGTAGIEAEGANGGSETIAIGRRESAADPLPGKPPVDGAVDAAFGPGEDDPAVPGMNRNRFQKVIAQPLIADLEGPAGIGREEKTADIAANVEEILFLGIPGDRLDPAAATRTGQPPLDGLAVRNLCGSHRRQRHPGQQQGHRHL
jgi:hypothetical protein